MVKDVLLVVSTIISMEVIRRIPFPKMPLGIKFVRFYSPRTKHRYRGIDFDLYKKHFLWLHIATASRGNYFKGKKVTFSTFQKNSRRGFGFSILEYSLLIQFGSLTKEDWKKRERSIVKI